MESSGEKGIPEIFSSDAGVKATSAWNKAIDGVKEEFNRYTNKESTPREVIKEGMNTLKNHETTKGLLSFFSNAANGNTLQLNLFGYRFDVTYQDRRNFVLLASM